MIGFLLAAVVACLAAQNVLKKNYTRLKKDSFIFNGFSALAAGIVFILAAGGSLQFDLRILPYSMAFAFFFGGGVVCGLMAVRTGSLALTSLINSYSLIIPTFFSLAFLGEKAGTYFLIGMGLLLISLFLVNREKGRRKITIKWIFFALLSFFGNGLCSTAQKLQQMAFDGAFKSEFMITVYLMVAAVMFALAFLKEREALPHCLDKSLFCSLSCGLANGIVNYLVMILLGLMPASVMFPLMSAGNVMATTCISFFYYKERFSMGQWLGIAMGAGAIVFLNL